MSDGLTVPMQLELLEADHLDHTKDEEFSTGARIVQGVEYDPIGRVSAYWLWPRHPGDRSVAYFTGQSVRVPEAIIAHLFEPVRIGQSRGISLLAPVLVAMRQHEKRREAERVRARAEACVFATIQGDNADGMAPDEGEDGEAVGASGYVEDQNGNPVDRFSPGGIYNVSNGHELDLHAPQASAGYDTAIRVEERTIATGIGLMYEHFGDLSQVNWASYRVGDVVTREIIDSWRETILEPMLLNRVWAAFVETCIAAGLIPARKAGYPVRHHWPVHQEMDREGGAKADIVEMRSGLVSLETQAERKGLDLAELIESHKRGAEAVAAAGLVFDGLPWQVAAGGTLQASPKPPSP
jgi:lambda family phage portal protein